MPYRRSSRDRGVSLPQKPRRARHSRFSLPPSSLHLPISPSSTTHETHTMQDWQPGQRYETGQQLRFGDQQFVVQQPHTSRSSLCPFPISHPIFPSPLAPFPPVSVGQRHLLRLTDSRVFSGLRGGKRATGRPTERPLSLGGCRLARTDRPRVSSSSRRAGRRGEGRARAATRRSLTR